LLSTYYTQAEVFDVTDELRTVNTRGRGYLDMDARFIVFRREDLKPFASNFGRAYSRFPVSAVFLEGKPMDLVHAPSRVIVDIPKGAQKVTVSFGMLPASYEGDPKTGGATFEVHWESGNIAQVLAERLIDPASRESDRGMHVLEIDLP